MFYLHLDAEMGTENSKEDILPATMVGVNGSGRVEVSSNGINIEGAAQGNLSDVKRTRMKRDLNGQLFIEPGR